MKMKKLNKKGNFDFINAGMLTFITFVLIVVLTIVLVSTLKGTTLVCDTNYFNGECFDCNDPGATIFNGSNGLCTNGTGGNLNPTVGGTAAYNGTNLLADAAALPPQFAQIIVIVVIIVGILALLAFVGFGTYERLKR